jgi:hypothetical protein
MATIPYEVLRYLAEFITGSDPQLQQEIFAPFGALLPEPWVKAAELVQDGFAHEDGAAVSDNICFQMVIQHPSACVLAFRRGHHISVAIDHAKRRVR